VVDEPRLAPGVNAIGLTYDFALRPELTGVMTAASSTGKIVNPDAAHSGELAEPAQQARGRERECQETGCALVERRRDGIVISGVKAIVTGAPYMHELLVMPGRNMIEADKIVEGFYACGVAASVYGKIDASGVTMPDAVFANIGKRLLATQIYEMHRLVHHLSGGLIVTLPGPDEDHNPETAARLSEVLTARSDIPYKERIEVARFIEDLTASFQAGWYSVISLHGGGSPEAMKKSSATTPWATKSTSSNASSSAASSTTKPAASPRTASSAAAAPPAAKSPRPRRWSACRVSAKPRSCRPRPTNQASPDTHGADRSRSHAGVHEARL
jgi:hypothetical protein